MKLTRTFQRAAGVALALAMLATLARPVSAPAQSTDPLAYTARTLANGLKVVVVEDHAAPVVQTQIWYRFGSLQETRGKTGLAHALEHMLFRGTPTLSSGGLFDMTARLGAQVNASTSNDNTNYYFVLPSDKLDVGLRVEADRMVNADITEESWKIERGAVLAELEGGASNPISKLFNATRQAAYGDTPDALTAIGLRADIEAATAADLRTYYKQYYAPNNATLVVTGDVSPVDVFTRAERYFGGIASQKVTYPTLAKAEVAHGKSVSVEADFPFTVVDLVYPGVSAIAPDNAAATALAAVINNPRSPFRDALVNSKLALQYQVFPESTLHAGLFHVFGFLAPGVTAAQFRSAFEATLAKQREGGVSPELLAATKQSASAQAIYARDSIAGVAFRVGYSLAVLGREPRQSIDAIAAVDGASLARVMATMKEPIVGELIPTRPKPGPLSTSPNSGTVSDDFSSRAPSGPIVQPEWLKTALAQPLSSSPKTLPNAFVLANGLRVLVQEIHTNPTVFVQGGIRTSARFEPPGKTGVADVTAMLLGYGGTKYDFAAQRKIADERAISFSYGPLFRARGLASDLPTMLVVLADAETAPAIPAQYYTLVHTQYLQQLSRRSSSPDYLAERAFLRLLLPPGDPALREPDEATLGSVTRDDVVNFAHTFYRPDLTQLTIVGDVTLADVRQQVEAAFGSWSVSGPKPDVSFAAVPLPKPATEFVDAVRDNVVVRIGQPFLNRRNKDYDTAVLLNAILGGGGSFDTRLFDEVREKRGLVYGISSSIPANRSRGTFEVAFQANPAKVKAAVAVVKAEMRRLMTEPVSASELAIAKQKLIARALVNEQSTAAIANNIDNIGRNDLSLDFYQTLANRYAAITAADIMRVAKAHFAPEHLVEVYQGPKATAER